MEEFTFLTFASICKWKSHKLVSFLSVELSGLLAPMDWGFLQNLLENMEKHCLFPFYPMQYNQNHALSSFRPSVFPYVCPLSLFFSFFPMCLLVFSLPSNDPVLSWGKAGGVGAGLC